MRLERALGLAGLLVALVVVLDAVQIPAVQTVRALIASAVLLVAPGYFLTFLIFPPRLLTASERTVFTLFMSFAVVLLTGLVLNLTPFGLTLWSWIWLDAGLLVLLGPAALARARWQP